MPAHLVSRLTLLLVVAVSVAACGSDPEPVGSPPAGAPIELVNTAWIVRSVAGRAPIAGAVPTISFSADAIAGSGGCNHLGGRYRYEPSSRRIAFAELGMTAMGCVQPGVGDFETVFVQALGSATQAGLDANGQLIVTGGAGEIVFVHLEHPGQGG